MGFMHLANEVMNASVREREKVQHLDDDFIIQVLQGIAIIPGKLHRD